MNNTGNGRKYMKIEKEDMDYVCERSLEYGVVAGLVENFYNPESENPTIGVVNLLADYHALKAMQMETFLNKMRKEYREKTS